MGTEQLAVQRDTPDLSREHYWFKVHGGLGDNLWAVGVKLSNLPLPLHISISNENRTRPRRSADLVRHLPNVVSWNYDTTAFCPDTGQDWPHPDDPCRAMGKKFSELGIRPNVKTRLECNGWLESGRRIEDWLPDIPTTHHFEFKPCGPPTIEVKNPSVILHLAGWPDVPDAVWISAADLFRSKCHVYIVGGSYDHRPRRIHEASRRCMSGVTLVEDTSWENLMGLLKGCTFCFGHASGFTALANALKVPGATFNPRSVPGLIGTWNSPENKGNLHVDKVSDFEDAISGAFRTLESDGRMTWPLSASIGPRIRVRGDRTGDGSPAAIAVRSACSGGVRGALVWSVGQSAPDDLPAAVLDGSYVAGRIVKRLDMVGFGESALVQAMKQSGRSTTRPAIEIYPHWPIPETDPYDTVVVHCSDRAAESAHAVRQGWSKLNSNGTILIGGDSSKTAAESLASMLKAVAAEIDGASGWYYLHRRL